MLTRPTWPSFSILAVAASLVSAVLADCRAAELHVGGATVNITPDRPVALAGQMHTRVSRTVESPVTATALALESREGDKVLDRAIMVSCDLVAIDAAILESVRRRVKDRRRGESPTSLLDAALTVGGTPDLRGGISSFRQLGRSAEEDLGP
jgi:hypothetical protein